MPLSGSQQSNPFVFVVGCPRSGTTLLQRMLDCHPLLTVAKDTHFITQAIKRVLRKDPNPALNDELVEQVLNYRRLYRLGLEDHEVRSSAAGCKTYAEFVSRLYSLRGEKHGKPLSGEKTPDFCRKILLLNGLFPAARYIHITRDGRDTVSSLMKWANDSKGPGKWSIWREDPLACCALWWRWQTGMGMDQGAQINTGLYQQLKYEDLVSNAEEQLAQLSAFLEIPYSSAMPNYYVGKTLSNPARSAKSAWLPPISGLRNWRKDMKAEDISVVEGIAGGLLERLQYPLSGTQPDAAAQLRIDRALDWWQAQPMRLKPQ